MAEKPKPFVRCNGKECFTAEAYFEAYQKAQHEVGFDLNDGEVMVNCFQSIPIGGPLKFDIAMVLMQYQWGTFLQLENGGIKNYWFRRAIRELARSRFVCLLGSSSSGKTFSAAAWVYTCWKCSARNTSAFLSSTGKDALQRRIWGTIRKMFSLDRIPLGQRLDYRDIIVLAEDKNDKDRFYENSIAGVALPPGSEGEKAIGQIIGAKNTNVIWAVDEYAHMDGNVVRQARGNLRSNENFQFIAMSNKPEEGDPMYIDAEPDPALYPMGWNTPGLDSKWRWKTRLGVCLYFDGMESPNLKAEGKFVPFPTLTTRQFIEDTITEDGMEDGPGFWRWVKGFPKSGELHDRVLTKQILQTFGADRKVVWGNEPVCVAGLDLGLRADGDPCCLDMGKVGKEFVDDKVGSTVLAHEEDAIQLPQSMSDNTPYEQQISKRVIDECEKRECHTLALDISGGGGTSALAIEKEAADRSYQLHIIAVEFGGSPNDEEFQIGDQRKPARQLFDRMVSQIWYSYRLAVQARQIRNVDLNSKAVRQLCERRVITDEKKRFQVEKKSEMKKRLRRSPDHADARCLLLIAARSVGLGSPKTMIDTPIERRIVMQGDQWEPKGKYRDRPKRSAYSSR